MAKPPLIATFKPMRNLLTDCAAFASFAACSASMAVSSRDLAAPPAVVAASVAAPPAVAPVAVETGSTGGANSGTADATVISAADAAPTAGLGAAEAADFVN